MVETKYNLEFELTKYTPYLTLTGEIWDISCEDLKGNLPCYNGTKMTALFMVEASTICNTIIPTATPPGPHRCLP